MKNLWIVKLIIIFFVGNAFFWIYVMYDGLRRAILLGGQVDWWSLRLSAIFLLATLVPIAILYRFAFPFSKEKAAEFLEKKNEVRMIEDAFSLIKTLLERLEKIFPEGNLEIVVQVMREDRKKILTGRKSEVAFSINDFKKGVKECDLSFSLAQEMIDELEGEIKATGFISQKQQADFLRRLVKYRQKLAAIKRVFEKYKSMKI